MKRRKRIAGFVILIFGMIVDLVGGIFLVYYLDKTDTCTLSIQAEVIGLDYHYNDFDLDNDDSSLACAPVFYYEVNNEAWTESYNIYSSLCSYEIGDQVELLIDPDNPDNFMIADSIWMQLTAGICLGVGTLLIILAYFLLRSAKKGVAMNKAGAFTYSYQPNSGTYGRPNQQPHVENDGQSNQSITQGNSYVLNGVKYHSEEIKQEGYYNLNGKIYKTKKNNNFN